MTTTTGVGTATGAGAATAARARAGSDQNFMQLLIAQLRNQSPLEPVDNDSMMQQMSQLSSMEEQKKLNDNLTDLLQFQGALARLDGLSRGASLIGKEVEYVQEGGGGTKASGVVEAVVLDEAGQVRLKIGDKQVYLQQVVGIRQKAAS